MGPVATLADLMDISGTNSQAQAGFDTSKNISQFGHDLTGEVNTDASKGTFYSGGAAQRSDWLRQQSGWKQGDIDFGLQQTLNNLAINRLLAAAGVSSLG